jgi:hypothetical protein
VSPQGLHLERQQAVLSSIGTFCARFGRLAMQQLGPFLAEHRGAPALMIDGRLYQIAELASARRN